jgi:hypothetical protein
MPDYGNMVDPGYMDEPIEESAKMPVWGWALIGVGGVVVIAVVIAAVRKKKAKKAQEDEDEDF